MVYRHIVGTWVLSGVCEKIAPVCHIFWPLLNLNLANMGQYVGFFLLFSGKVPLNSHETWFMSLLQLLLEVCKKIGQRDPNFQVILDPQSGKNLGFWPFCQTLPLDSHQSWFTCSLELLLEVRRIWVSEARFSGNFGFPNRSKEECPLHAHITWFISMLQLLLEVCKMLQRPIFRVILGPQIDQNSGFRLFCLNVSSGLTSI